MIIEKKHSYQVEYPDPQLGCSISKKMPRIRTEDSCQKSEYQTVGTPKWLARFIFILIGLMIAITLLGCSGSLAWAGETQNLTASYYSVDSLKEEGTYAYSHGQMANGQYFRDSNATSACNSYPLGARLRVTNLRNGRNVVVLNTDRTAKRFKNKRIDLSISAMAQIDGIKRGLERVTVERI